jgi:antitoxin MazE
MTEQVTLKAWGNSFGIRIPRKFLEKLDVKDEDVLQLEAVEDTIIIRKAFRHKTFEERLAAYNGMISTEPFEWGEPKGREIL